MGHVCLPVCLPVCMAVSSTVLRCFSLFAFSLLVFTASLIGIFFWSFAKLAMQALSSTGAEYPAPVDDNACIASLAKDQKKIPISEAVKTKREKAKREKAPENSRRDSHTDICFIFLFFILFLFHFYFIFSF